MAQVLKFLQDTKTNFYILWGNVIGVCPRYHDVVVSLQKSSISNLYNILFLAF